MYVDDFLLLSSAQAFTSSTNSTNLIDSLAAGDAIEANPILHILVNTAFAGSASSVQFALQSSSDNSTWVNLCSITKAYSALTAKEVLNLQIPPGKALRYLRAYYTITTGTVSAGAVTAFLAKDVDVTMDKTL